MSTPVAVAQWIRCGSSSHRVVHAGGLNPGGDSYQFFFVLLYLMYFSDIVWWAK